MLKSLEDITSLARSITPRKRIFVAAADEHAALESCSLAYREGLADITLVGGRNNIESIALTDSIDLSGITVIDIPDEKDALIFCMESYWKGEADLLMKGKVSTGKMMQTALKKEYGLRTDRILSHIGIFEYDGRLVIMSDGGMNIAPDISRKAGIIENAVQVAHALGINHPNVAVLAAVEKVQLHAMPATRDALILQRMNERGEITGCRVEGPLSLDIALSPHAAKTKGTPGIVPGRADIIIVPDIECGNVIYKAVSTIHKSPIAGVLTGSRTPMIIISRADSTESKLYSMGVNIYLAHNFSKQKS